MRCLFLPLLFITLSACAQNPFFASDTVYYGQVYAVRNGEKHPMLAQIEVIGADGNVFDISTDWGGNYHLDSIEINPVTSYVLRFRELHLGPEMWEPETVKLPYSCSDLRYPKKVDVELRLRDLSYMSMWHCRVFMDDNSMEIDTNSAKELQVLTRHIKRKKGWIKVQGKAPYDVENREEFALKRAQIVAKHLQTLGVKRESIKIEVNLLPHRVIWQDEAFKIGQELTEDFVLSLTDEREKELAKKLNSHVFVWFDN